MIEMPEIFQKVKLQIAVVLRRVLKDNFSFLKDSLSLASSTSLMPFGCGQQTPCFLFLLLLSKAKA